MSEQLNLTLIHPQTRQILKQWEFLDLVKLRVGRLGDNDVVLDQFPEVSRYHFDLQKLDQPQGNYQWLLTNHGTNGTFVNQKLVSQALIPNHCSIQLAKDGPILQLEIKPILAINKPSIPSGCTHQNNPPNNLFCVHCGQPLVEQEVFIRQYQILKTLGQGGMGTTYIAWDRQGSIKGKPILLVLKEMNADMAQIAKARELFEREARVLKSLQHPGIPQYYDFFVENNQKYLAMELVHGQNLEERIYSTGVVTPQEALQWMMQTCEILGYLHQLDPPLIHRDIKPANLMLRKVDGRIVLLDFGAVKEIGTPPGTRISTEGYSAPEQNRGQPYPQSDLYAIGPTLIFLLTGQSPLKYYQRQGDNYRFCIQNVPTIPPQLAKVIEKASDPTIRDRYQTAQELLQALKNC